MKPRLLLLHGAAGSKTQFHSLASALRKTFEIHSFNFSGHGGEPISESGFCRRNVLLYNGKNIARTDIFGYSMGGYVGLYMAKYFPASVNKICTLATKLDWTETAAEKESRMLVPEKIEEKVPEFAKQLRKRHAPQDWKVVLRKTAGMIMDMGKLPPLSKNDFNTIHHTIRLTVGEKDKMVSMDETQETAALFPNATCVFLRNVPHPIEQVPTEIVEKELIQFFLS